jgi:hypothetical protein
MIALRFGEEGNQPFRNQRLFIENGQWYFDTREGTQVGPFHDVREVKKALAAFVAQRLLIANNNNHIERSCLPGSQDGIEHMVEELFNFFLEYKLNGQEAAMLWAKQRLRELLMSSDNLSGCSGRIEAMYYALDLDT